MADPDLLYHYTTTEGFLEILKESMLWATEWRYLNDQSEIEYRYGLLDQLSAWAKTQTWQSAEQALVAACIDRLDDIRFSNKYLTYFVACFCENGDLLSQWREYATDNGFCLGFDRSALEAHGAPSVRLLQLEYDPDIQAQRLQSEFVRVLRGPHATNKTFDESMKFLTPIVLTALHFKHPAFNREEEWRLIRVMNLQDAGEMSFRSDRLGVLPYVALKIGNGVKSALRRVVIGPTAHRVEADLAAHLLLRKHGLSDVEVHFSDVPMRPYLGRQMT